MKRLFVYILSFVSIASVSAQTSDNGDGTFTNPVIWTDMPDPDVTQVGDTFYMVNTSMHILPGVTIVKSCDLVNWEFATNVVPQFDNDPFFNMQGGNRYGKGQWATAIRYWGGQFHVLFTSNSNGCFIYSSPTMEGPWKKTTLYDGPYHPILDRVKPLDEQRMACAEHGRSNDGFSHHILYDPGFLVDNDGRVYVVHGNTVNYITEIDPETYQAKGPARLLYKRHREGLEGNRPYHIGDFYYVICTYGGSHSGNVTCMRSRSLEGPWEEREVMRVGARKPDSHILQACLIPLKSGETWAMAFLDMDELGRIPHLVPVHWIDDWPVFGDFANGNITLPKPNIQTANTNHLSPNTLATKDDFSSTKLGIQWQFNHNPDWTKVSLTKRPGWLRLYSQKANQPLSKKDAKNHLVKNDNPVSKATIEVSDAAPFLMARNILTQRLFGPRTIATAKVDVSNIKSGDCAGFGLLNIPYGLLSVSRTAKGFFLSQKVGDDKKEQSQETIALTKTQAKSLWLRVDAEATGGTATFSYSLDGKSFSSIGKRFQMVYSGSYFVGNRLALFCYGSTGSPTSGGYMDVDDFDVKVLPLFDHTVKKGSVLEAEWTDALWRAELRWIGGKNPEGRQAVASVEDGAMIAFNRLQYAEPVKKLTFKVCNENSKNTFVELTDAVTGEVLGTADIPSAKASYVPVAMALTKPLVSGHRIEIRLWNHDWDQPHMGRILIDNIKFE